MKLHMRDEPFFRSNVINQQMLEDNIEKIETTRSCPTGFFNKELKKTSTVELLHIRRSAYEYLNAKSQKTKNLEFVYLIKRINKELKNRNINVPIYNISNPKNYSDFDEISAFLNKKQDIHNGEYCYLARKHIKDNSNDDCIENMIIRTHFFSYGCFNLPNFIQDDISQSKIALAYDNDLKENVEVVKQQPEESFASSTV